MYDDGDSLYCLKCKEEILYTDAEFERLVKVYNIDWQRLQEILKKNEKQNLK